MMHEILNSDLFFFFLCCGKIGAFAHLYHINGVQCQTHVCEFLKLFFPHISLPTFVALFLEEMEKGSVHTLVQACAHTHIPSLSM